MLYICQVSKVCDCLTTNVYYEMGQYNERNVFLPLLNLIGPKEQIEREASH